MPKRFGTYPQVAGFVNYYLTYAPEDVSCLDYFPIKVTLWDESKTKFWQGQGNQELLQEAS